MNIISSSLLALVWFIVFAVSLRALVHLCRRPLDLSRRQEFSTQALRFERFYQTAAIAILTLIASYLSVLAFIEAFRQMPA